MDFIFDIIYIERYTSRLYRDLEIEYIGISLMCSHSIGNFTTKKISFILHYFQYIESYF